MDRYYPRGKKDESMSNINKPNTDVDDNRRQYYKKKLPENTKKRQESQDMESSSDKIIKKGQASS